LDLALKDFCEHFEIKREVDKILLNTHTTSKICPTRWTSYKDVMEELDKL
jgi:hypothetical protein